eukprot:SAG31_NODE_18150_length_645_cov_1.137363_1_plen_159_part_10
MSTPVTTVDSYSNKRRFLLSLVPLLSIPMHRIDASPCLDPLASNSIPFTGLETLEMEASVAASDCMYDCSTLAASLLSSAAVAAENCYHNPAERWLTCTSARTFAARGADQYLTADSVYLIAVDSTAILHGRRQLRAQAVEGALLQESLNSTALVAWDY